MKNQPLILNPLPILITVVESRITHDAKFFFLFATGKMVSNWGKNIG
jgi:hypothetical protein